MCHATWQRDRRGLAGQSRSDPRGWKADMSNVSLSTEQAAELRTFVSYTLPTPIRVLRNVILSEVESSMPL
jgi:hypothetical protein